MFKKPKMTSKFYAWEEFQQLQLELTNNNPQTLTGGSIFYDEAYGISQVESDITTNPSTSENLDPMNSAFTEFKPWLSKVMCECTTKCVNCIQDIEDLYKNKKESGHKKGRKISKALTKAFRRNHPQEK